MSLSTYSQMMLATLFSLVLLIARGVYPYMPGYLKPCWAVFFLTGMYLSSGWAFLAMLALVICVDAYVEAGPGLNFFRSCMTRAYIFLAPAYAALWWAGDWYSRHHSLEQLSFVHLYLSLIAGATVAQLLSSGGFYFFSGYFPQPNLREFAQRERAFYPRYLATAICYVAIACVVHLVAMTLR